MKKKLFAALAATLAGATLSFSACTSGDSKIVFGNYWNYNTEPTSHELIDETLVYDVTFSKHDSVFINYELDYEGTYTTTLVSNAGNTYKFTSTLDVRVTFTVGGESETKNDSVYTEVIFYEAGGEDNLRPVSSKKTIVSHTPLSNNSASKPKDCYQLFDYKIETTYTDGNGSCVLTKKLFGEDTGEYAEFAQEYSFSASSSKRSVLDNEQFPVAFRALPKGTDASVQMFNPFIGHTQNYAVALSKDAKEAAYTYTLDGVKDTRTLKYLTASIAVDGTSSGQAQWAEIAEMQDPKTNGNRNIMLRYYAPLSYNMGILEYKLESATYNA